MLLFRFITPLLVMTLATVVGLAAATPWGRSGDIEPSRGEVIPYNSDSLFRGASVGRDTTLLMQNIGQWQSLPDMGDGEVQYITYFISPYEWLGREVLLRFEYVDSPFSLEVNGQMVGRAESGNLPVEFNVTDFSAQGTNNITVTLHDTAPVKEALESWRKGGEVQSDRVRGVRAISPATITMRDVYSRSRVSRDSVGGAILNSEIGVVVKSHMLNSEVARVRYRLTNHMGERVAVGMQDIQLEMRQEDTVRIAVNIPRGAMWSADSPFAHTLELNIYYDRVYEEYLSMPLGLRSVAFEDGALLFNGERVMLKAERVSPTTTRSQVADMANSGVNTLLISSGEYAENLLKICDDMGLYAIVTAAVNSSSSGKGRDVGGNPSNDPALCKEYIDRAERCYYTYRRHPSLVGLAIAESSANGYNLYESYIALKEIVGDDIAVIYLDAEGEWNSDKIDIDFVK